MILSLNEIEVIAKRAARGAGMHWGHAEETGKAVRWLAAQGLPWPEIFLSLLNRVDGAGFEHTAPKIDGWVWNARSDFMSPITAGAALVDRADVCAAEDGIEIKRLAYPLILAPYVAGVSTLMGKAFELSWPGFRMMVSTDIRAITGTYVDMSQSLADCVVCGNKNSALLPPREIAPFFEIEDSAFSGLSEFAARTFAPATEASRVSGAGAGLIDVD